jgi:ABC-type dipeptide/oligopeptide/nickel transport system permease component
VLSFTLHRAVLAVPVLFLASIGIFLLLHLVPGDPASLAAGPDATPEMVQAVRKDYGLDQPLPVQYAYWLAHVAHGDFGQSYVNHLPVIQLIGLRLPATLELAFAALAIQLAVALPTGVLAALHRRGPLDWLFTSINGAVIAVPNFWLGLLAIILFGLVLRWLPAGGFVPVAQDPAQGARYLLLPAATLALGQAAVLSRFVKTAMLDVLHQEYVRTARAKGLESGRVVRNHVLRNALVPVATVLGLQFGRMLGGVVVIESVFAWPGVGSLLLDSVEARDYTVVQATLLMLVLIFVLVNLATDVVYSVLDPRIQTLGHRGRA